LYDFFNKKMIVKFNGIVHNFHIITIKYFSRDQTHMSASLYGVENEKVIEARKPKFRL